MSKCFRYGAESCPHVVSLIIRILEGVFRAVDNNLVQRIYLSFYDISSAFDTVEHILLNRLSR